MNILISNDDGWDAPGIIALIEVAREFGDCTIVAPSTEQSGVSHQQTMRRPMTLVTREPHIWSLDGTPSDCVRVALLQTELFLSDSQFDFVLSGINNGGNLGADIYVSGTVAAAREAALFGLPGIAISQHRLRFAEPFDWTHSKELARNAIRHCIEAGFRHRELININLPDISDREAAADITIIDPCPLDPAPRHGSYDTQNISGTTQISSSGVYNQRFQTPGSDVAACFAKQIPVTRLRY